MVPLPRLFSVSFSVRSTFWTRIIIDDQWMQRTLDKHIEGIVAFFLDRTGGKSFSFKSQYSANPWLRCTFVDILAHLTDHSEQ